ncbi:MAG: hypothetical protein JST00_17000 [Deltaproteobacteria bacterium]|nr:hypothetical protein [Deltaproteobacteria bacterium]
MDGSPRSVLPKAFRSLVVLRNLNIAAMGLSLAAATATAFSRILGSPNEFGMVALATGMPTLLLGLLWAALLRSRKTIGKSKVRWGWVLSIPLAALNGAFACGLLFAGEGSSDAVAKFFVGALAGGTIGMFFWLPALVLTLAFFGLPVSWSQTLATKGLAGEEKGERVLGITSTVLATFALLAHSYWEKSSLDPRNATIEMLGHAFSWGAPILALLAGSLAMVLALARERRRRTFVTEVEAGKVEGFRIEEAPEGKVLMRVSTLGAQGGAYRVADFEEEVFALDEQGAAREERRGMAMPRRGAG